MSLQPNEYVKGNIVRLTVDPANPFKALGVTTDPTTVTIKYRTPTGTLVSKTYVTDPEVIKDSLGVFHMDVVLDMPGEWWYRIEGTGACVAAVEKSLYVQPTKL